ncbi:MAG: hypothetical protein LN575_01820 [Rickettsia endosymbiont of Gnoriste bilineata]|nr:hypothetical protein [Rickettsia endosymbiont of Gnoriste bilineata]
MVTLKILSTEPSEPEANSTKTIRYSENLLSALSWLAISLAISLCFCINCSRFLTSR